MEQESHANTSTTPYTTPAKDAAQPLTPEGSQRAGQVDQPAEHESIMTKMLKQLFTSQVSLPANWPCKAVV